MSFDSTRLGGMPILGNLIRPLSARWRSGVFGMLAYPGVGLDELPALLNDADLHVVDFGHTPDAYLAVRYNPLAYSRTAIVAKLAHLGAIVEDRSNCPPPAARSLWLASQS